MAFLYGIDMNLCTENINITYRDDPDPLSFTDPHFKYVFKYGGSRETACSLLGFCHHGIFDSTNVIDPATNNLWDD